MFGNILVIVFMIWGISENINGLNLKMQRGEKIINKEKQIIEMKRVVWNNEYVRLLMLEVLIIYVLNVVIQRMYLLFVVIFWV